VEYLGKGIYTYKDASSITGVRIESVRRWFDGYKDYKSNRRIGPLIKREYQNTAHQKLISFLDLIELLFINAFHSYRVSLQSIRIAVNQASLLLKTDHPFATKKFYTDGKTILAEIIQGNDSALVDLIKQQYQISEIVFPLLYNCIDFRNYEVAQRYWPLGKDRGIVIDPSRNFGKPILNDLNVSVHTISDLLQSGHSEGEISEWYEIASQYIELAKEYELRLSA